MVPMDASSLFPFSDSYPFQINVNDKMNNQKTTLLMFVIMCLSISGTNGNYVLQRQKRKLPLMFNDFGVSQFVCGFGIPVDLNFETVTTGIVFKSQLPLPSKFADLRNHTTHNVNGRLIDGSESNRALDKHMRWEIYKALELWATNFGLNGRVCVLKTICEAAQIPFNIETGDLLHEIVHIIFAPFSSMDEINEYRDNEYYFAAKIGLSHVNSCSHTFNECPTSLLQMFSKILQ